MKTLLVIFTLIMVGCKGIVLSPEPETINGPDVITDEIDIKSQKKE